MGLGRGLFSFFVAALLLLAARTACAQWALDGVGKVIAISDIHGAQAAFVETLQAPDVVDTQLAWSAGDSHLVIVGDILDRGNDSRQTMDLLMRLEREAAKAGGRVHVVLGNHELMNLVGDLRYVSRAEYAAFADDEAVGTRDAVLGKMNAAGSPLTRDEFDARFPPGFFGHRAAFSASGKYGRWLLEKPLALRINDSLFAHAGLSEALVRMDLETLNGALRNELIEYVKLLEQMSADGPLDPTIDFYDVPDVLAKLPEEQKSPAVARLLTLHESMIHDQSSPLWYRGNVGCGPLIEQDRLAGALKKFGVSRVVVGHTPTFQRKIWRRLDDRVFLIDAGMLHSYYSGQGAALVIDGSQASAVYQGQPQARAIDTLPQRTGVLSAGLTPDELEQALREGEVVDQVETSDAVELTLSWRGHSLKGSFSPAGGRNKSFFPAVAAYRLDRALQLGMVASAVVRELNGETGTLVYLPSGLISEARRVAERIYVPAWCPLADQYQAMYLFDALIANAPRTGDEIHYSRTDGEVILGGHRNAFGNDTGVPRHLAGVELRPSALWRQRLAGLDADAARSLLEDVLPNRAIKALVRRAAALAEK
jgi:hypothetical protein